MGILDTVQGRRVYLDTNIWIYALEGYPAFIQDLTQLFQYIDQGNLSAVTSELSLAEVLVKPYQNQDLENLTVIPISRQVLIEAAQLRASLSIKLPDAIHAAIALLTQCSTFLTNDQHFQSVPSLTVVLLSQINSP